MSLGPFELFGAMVGVIVVFAVGAVVAWKLMLARQLKALKAEGSWRDAPDSTGWAWKWEGGSSNRSVLGQPIVHGPTTQGGVVVKHPQVCFLGPVDTAGQSLMVLTSQVSVFAQSDEGIGRWLSRHVGDGMGSVANRCQVVSTTDPAFEERYLVATTDPMLTQCLHREVRQALLRFYQRYRMHPIILIHGGVVRVSLQRARASGSSLRDAIAIGEMLMASWRPHSGSLPQNGHT